MQLTVVRYHQWSAAFALLMMLSFVWYQEVSAVASQARITRSAVEDLRDHGTYIVHFKSNATEEDMQHFVDRLGKKTATKQNFAVEIIEELFVIKCLTARLSVRALNWVACHSLVIAVKENEYILVGSGRVLNSSHHVPVDWHLDRLDQSSLPLDGAFDVNYTGSNVDVYVLDSGIHYEHSVFNGRALYPGCDPIDKIYHQSQAGRDCEGHGTHVAGLVGGNGTGVATGVTLFSVRILNCGLIATEASLIQGLVCVVNHRQERNATRAVINLSIAGLHTTSSINKALQLALDNSIIITASSGNGPNGLFRSINYDSCKVYPAGYPGVISVGATDIRDNVLMGEFDGRTYLTSIGACLDVFAPGYNILSSDICSMMPCHDANQDCEDGVSVCRRFRSGTSQSAAVVSGAIALLLEKCPEVTNKEVKHLLRHSLSISKVVSYKEALRYLMKNPSLLYSILDTFIRTTRGLLYVGDLANTINCTVDIQH